MQAPPPPAPSADDEPARHSPARREEGRRRRVPTFTLLPINGLGAQLCPCGLATPTPQFFGVASLPATCEPAREFPANASTRRSPAQIRQVGAGGVTLGVLWHWFLTYTFPSCLPGPDRLAVPTRPVVVRAACHLRLRLQGQAALSFTRAAATARRRSPFTSAR